MYFSNKELVVFAALSCCLLCLVDCQRAPPGVNPQVYQQQPQLTPQQAQQMAMQQQQAQQMAMQQQQQAQQMAVQQQQQQRVQQPQAVPQRQGQPPPQQVQGHPQQVQQPAPQQVQQPPPQQMHQGQHPPPPPGQHQQQQQLLQAQHINQEQDHIREHVGVPVDTAQMSEQELQFHYFKMHDADNNNKLDGCELVKSLIHWHDEANHDPSSGQPIPEPKIFTNEELISMIDPILDQDDRNKDGFIDYPEFIQAQQAASRP